MEPVQPEKPLESVESAQSIDDTASATDSDSDSEGSESIGSLLDSFKTQIKSIEVASRSVDKQMQTLFQKAKKETIQWMHEPLTPTKPIEAWLAAREILQKPTLDQFFDSIFAAATSMDYESRVLTFSKEDAAVLWRGARTLTVFDMIGQLPRLFL